VMEKGIVAGREGRARAEKAPRLQGIAGERGVIVEVAKFGGKVLAIDRRKRATYERKEKDHVREGRREFLPVDREEILRKKAQS